MRFSVLSPPNAELAAALPKTVTGSVCEVESDTVWVLVVLVPEVVEKFWAYDVPFVVP